MHYCLIKQFSLLQQNCYTIMSDPKKATTTNNYSLLSDQHLTIFPFLRIRLRMTLQFFLFSTVVQEVIRKLPIPPSSTFILLTSSPSSYGLRIPLWQWWLAGLPCTARTAQRCTPCTPAPPPSPHLQPPPSWRPTDVRPTCHSSSQ